MTGAAAAVRLGPAPCVRRLAGAPTVNAYLTPAGTFGSARLPSLQARRPASALALPSLQAGEAAGGSTPGRGSRGGAAAHAGPSPFTT
eukprot:SAG11_NODE_16052_length_558_cov_0.989107_1_plen_87_part_10